MKHWIILSILILCIFSYAGCSGSSGVTPDRGTASVGIIGDPGEFPDLDLISEHLQAQFGEVCYIAPGEYPQGMKYIFVTAYAHGPRIDRIREFYFNPGQLDDTRFWPEPVVCRQNGRSRPDVKMVFLIGRNRDELKSLLEYVCGELKKGKPFDFEGGEWHFQERMMDPAQMPMRERQAQWNWEAHRRMCEVAATEMGYASKTRKDAGAAYSIGFYYNGELKHTSYIYGDETPMQLLIRGSWELDVIHDDLFTGVFDNLLYRKLGHAWFPPDGWVGSADTFAWEYGYAAALNFIWNTEGRAYYFLGLTTHLIEDVGIPLHTNANIADQILWHTPIEEDLDEFWYQEIDYALPGQPVHPFTNLTGAIAELATASNADFDDLISGYVWGWLYGYEDYYTVARNNAMRATSYVKGLYQLAEPYTW